MDVPMEKQRRKQQASLPFPEKIKILEKLRDRSLVIARSPLRQRQRHPT